MDTTDSLDGRFAPDEVEAPLDPAAGKRDLP